MQRGIGFLLFAAACTTPQYTPDPLVSDFGPPQHHALLAEEPESEGAERPDAERESKNEVIVFTGYTTERGEGGFTLGLSYKRAVNNWLNLVGFGELVFGSHPASVVGFGPAFSPVENLVLVSLLGVEFERGASGEGLLRLGGSYKVWEFAGAEIKPGVFVDLFGNRDVAWVFGLEFGWDF